MSKNFYITTTLPYVNADPHIGFALEIVSADTIARYRRLLGDQVFFNTGTDEHGQKIWEASQKEGKDVRDYVDYYSSKFEKLKQSLNISNDAFIRTTDENHVIAAQEIWRRCDKKGDIYKKSYKGDYCVGCESFKTEKDLDENGKCFIHPNLEIKKIEEENYFFKLSNYQDQLLEYLSKEESILPSWRREEAINFVKSGLEDFSISREKERLSWGIPVPGDDSQVMYVWFDALTNYISTLGWPVEDGDFKKFWQDSENIQFAGKDQIRFQSIMWQAMLMSADIKNTEKIVYHGFITSGGQKMSKSLGNVINPYDLVDEFGTDAVRFFLLRHVHPFEDSDVTKDRFKELYNADLANGLGNLVSRVMKLAEDNIEPLSEANLSYSLENTYVDEKIKEFRVDLALVYIWDKIGELDKEIQEKKPWETKDRELIQALVKKVGQIGYMLEPFLPDTSKKIIEAVKKNNKPETALFLRK